MKVQRMMESIFLGSLGEQRCPRHPRITDESTQNKSFRNDAVAIITVLDNQRGRFAISPAAESTLRLPPPAHVRLQLHSA